jgi:regulator of protease activity HflC (stomatin/prohibitin superfamily)
VQLALREYVGKLSLDELLDSKQALTENVLKTVGAKGNELGVEILDAGVKDIILPGDVKEIMNRVLVAQKQAQANVITRREETASTRSMLNTAKILEENEMLYKLKEMEYVEKIAEKIGDITLSGNGQVLNQLKDIFSVK